MKNLLNVQKSKSGTTMVEVLVAFMVVMIMVVMFGKAVNISASLLVRSNQTIQRTQSFDEEYYKLSPNGATSTLTNKIQLSVDMNKTNRANQAASTRFELKEVSLFSYKDVNTGMTRYSFDSRDREETPGE